MNSYILKNKECIDFFKSNVGVDFETSVLLIVRLMKTVMKNMKDSTDSHQNTELLKTLSSKINSLYDNKNENENIQKRLFQEYKEGVLQSVREIINTDNNQQVTNIKEIIQHSRKHDDGGEVAAHIEKLLKHRDVLLKERLDYLSKSQMEKQDKILEKIKNRDGSIAVMDEYFRKQMGSNSKGKQGERCLELVLSKTYPSATILNTAGQTAMGDFILKRANTKVQILIDTKDYDTVIPDREVEKFFRDIEAQKMDGILLSQSSGIAQKHNYEFMLHGGNIALFIHNVDYDMDKIRIGVDMIDQFRKILDAGKVSKGNVMQSDESIPREILSCINQEYNVFISTRLQMMDQLKKQYQDNMGLIEKVQLPSLERYLEPKFANIKKGVYICDVCDIFVGKNKKSLAAHRKTCVIKKEKEQEQETIVVETGKK